MRYTADSWFFIQLNKQNDKAMRIWSEITQGKGKLVVPTIVLVEITKRFLRKGLNKELDKLMLGLEKSDKIFLVELTPEIATLAGKFGNSYNIPTVDSVILATSVVTGFTNLLSEDKHFIPADKEDKIKRIRF